MSNIQEIRVLTINLPWAGWLFHPHHKFGLKTIENRSWRSNYRGPLFIHANKWQPRPPADTEVWQPFYNTAEDFFSLWEHPEINQIQPGSIIGCVDVVASGDPRDFEEVFWKKSNRSQRRLTPNQLDLFANLPDDLEDNPEWKWWTWDGGLVVRRPQLLIEPIRGISGKLNIWSHQVNASRLTLGDIIPVPAIPEKPAKKPRRTSRKSAKV